MKILMILGISLCLTGCSVLSYRTTDAVTVCVGFDCKYPHDELVETMSNRLGELKVLLRHEVQDFVKQEVRIRMEHERERNPSDQTGSD